MAPPTIAPAITPPTTPAPTAQPKQRASAVVGTAKGAKATAEAAARAVKVFVINPSPSWGCVAARPIPNTDSQPVPSYGQLEPAERKPLQFVGNLLRSLYC